MLEKPTKFDSLDCSSAYRITLIVSGIIDKTTNCKLVIPSTYFGKNSEIIKGEIIIVTIAIKIDTIMDETIIIRWDIPLDFSERRNECKAVGRTSNPNKICKFN